MQNWSVVTSCINLLMKLPCTGVITRFYEKKSRMRTKWNFEVTYLDGVTLNHQLRSDLYSEEVLDIPEMELSTWALVSTKSKKK